jgi:PilZ domain
MPPSGDQLVVRQHERLLCRLGAQLRVDESHTSQIALSRNVGEGTGSFGCAIVDCSRGGLGLETTFFLPRSCRIMVIVTDAQGTKMEFAARVQRVAMTDRKPTYYLGVAFTTSGDVHDQRVMTLLKAASNAPQVPATAAPTGNSSATGRGAA